MSGDEDTTRISGRREGTDYAMQIGELRAGVKALREARKEDREESAEVTRVLFAKLDKLTDIGQQVQVQQTQTLTAMQSALDRKVDHDQLQDAIDKRMQKAMKGDKGKADGDTGSGGHSIMGLPINKRNVTAGVLIAAILTLGGVVAIALIKDKHVDLPGVKIGTQPTEVKP